MLPANGSARTSRSACSNGSGAITRGGAADSVDSALPPRRLGYDRLDQNRPPAETSMRRLLVLCSGLLGLLDGASAQAPALTPFGAAGGAPAAPWHVVGLPQQTKPFTQFSVVD